MRMYKCIRGVVFLLLVSFSGMLGIFVGDLVVPTIHKIFGFPQFIFSAQKYTDAMLLLDLMLALLAIICFTGTFIWLRKKLKQKIGAPDIQPRQMMEMLLEPYIALHLLLTLFLTTISVKVLSDATFAITQFLFRRRWVPDGLSFILFVFLRGALYFWFR